MLIFDKFNNLIGDFNVSFHKPDFRNADLRNADLGHRILKGADLSGADLRGSNLHQAELNDYTLLPKVNLPKFQIPQSKSLIVWKKLYDRVGTKDLICKLRIPQRARRTASLVGKKCRAERAFVEEIFSMRSLKNRSDGFSIYDPNFRYEVGKQVWVLNFNDDIRYECRCGIHFFVDRKDAERY